MTDDDRNGDKPKSRGIDGLSDEAIERVKRAVLFGENNDPPRNSGQFKKGQSGNPKGRPKKPDLGGRSVDALVLAEGDRLIPVREGQNTSELTEIAAVIRKQYAIALSGNAYAQKHVIQRRDWAELRKRERIARDIEVWEKYVHETRQAMAQAKAKGEPMPEPLPHPDDIIINYEEGVSCIGPMNEKQLEGVKKLVRMRDTLIMQHALDEKLWKVDYTCDPLQGPGTAWLAALWVDQKFVPKRFRLSETLGMMRLRRYQVTNKRTLLKDVYRAWRALLGLDVRRGKTTPPLGVGKAFFERVNALSAEEDAAA
ncbi:MAG: DUF5681 domain-containing protein [Xanthobacteraceae bacterium]